MIQTYQGYILEDGRFIPDDLSVKFPTRRRAIVNIIDDEVDQPFDLRNIQREAFEDFFASMQALNDEGLELIDDEFDTILAERVNITRELAL